MTILDNNIKLRLFIPLSFSLSTSREYISHFIEKRWQANLFVLIVSSRQATGYIIMRFLKTLRFVLSVFGTVGIMSDMVNCERRRSFVDKTTPPGLVKSKQTITQAAPCIEEGALLGNCQAEDCILGYGGSTAWNAISVSRQSQNRQDYDDDAMVRGEDNDERSSTSFGRIPSFVSRKDGPVPDNWKLHPLYWFKLKSELSDLSDDPTFSFHKYIFLFLVVTTSSDN
jgi:hypothetical protein